MNNLIENRKSSTRCKKTVYYGIEKNMNQSDILFARTNLVIVMGFRAGRSNVLHGISAPIFREITSTFMSHTFTANTGLWFGNLPKKDIKR